MWILRLLSLLFLVFGSGLSAGDRRAMPGGAYGFRTLGAENGLENTAVKALATDSEGFLWVGTEDGVFRLEGNHFRRFGVEDGLPAARILDLGLSLAQPRGLWVGTDQGMALWNGQRFLNLSEFGPKGLKQAGGGALPQGGAILIDEPNKVRYIGHGVGDFQPIEGLPWGPQLTAITLSPDGRILAIGLGLRLWVRRNGVWNGGGAPITLPQEATSLWVDRKGDIWVRTANRLFRLGADSRLAEIAVNIPLSTLGISPFAEDPEGRIWTATTQGLVWIGPEGSGFIGESDGLPRGAAGALTVDREGTLWCGADGVHKLLGGGRWTSWTRAHGLPSDIVWSVRRAGDGRLWVGTAAGLAVFEKGRWQSIPGTLQHQIMSLASEASGRLWAGIVPNSSQEHSGVWVCEPGQRTVRRIHLAGVPPNASALSMHPDASGKLWLGMAWAGLWRMDLADRGRKVERIVIPNWPKDHGIQAVAGDGSGGLWVTGGSWVGHFNGRTWAVLGPEGGMPAQDAVLAMSPAPKGSAWLAYHLTKGLDRVQREGDRLVVAERLGKGHPLAQHQTYSLLTEPDGILWAGTNRGLLRWDGKRAERYGRNAGLPGEDCSQGAIWRDPDGDLFVGLSVGIARGEVARQAPQLPPPAMIMAAEDARARPLVGGGTPQVQWRERTLLFRYAAGGSRWTEDTTFQVRLLGLEEAWRNTKLPEARYTELSPGHYRFEVRAVTFLGEPGATAGFEVEILPPWWRRTWALALWLLLLGFLARGYFYWRMANLRQRNSQLEAMVRERTEALEVANAALQEASLTDPLTGLNNRRYLAITMPEDELGLRRIFRDHLQRGESPLGRNEDMVLFLMDLDHFKRVNDSYGHAAGDAVLKQTAEVLRANSRSSDTLVRWGGEEFLLVAKRTDRDRSDLLARAFCKAIREHTYQLPDGRTITCTISLGYAPCPILDQVPEAFTWEDSLQAADQCLYAAKRAGRDGWKGIHTSGLQDPVLLGPRLREDLEGLAAEGRIVLRSGRV